MYKCVCKEGYHGINCDNEIDECYSMPCVHGSCTDLMNGYSCICPPGYFGQHCEGKFISKYADTLAGIDYHLGNYIKKDKN